MNRLTFDIVSNNAAPLVNNGLFDIRQTHEYELDGSFTVEQILVMARKWFLKQMEEYGVKPTIIEASLGCVCREELDKEEGLLSTFYYLGCRELEDMQFPYELIYSTNKALELQQFRAVETERIQEEINYLLERGHAA